MKKLLILVTILLLFSMVFASPFTASTHDVHKHDEHEHTENEIANESKVLDTINTDEGEFGVLYLPCPQGGKHTVGPRGYGQVYINGKVALEGPSSQCSKCYVAIVTEFNPFSPYVTAFGNYAISDFSRPLGTNTKIYNSPVKNNTYKTNAPFDGFTWNIGY